MLPLARRVFPNLPDGGLAAGRVLFLTLVALFVYWGAMLRVVPLALTPLWIFGLPLLCRRFARHDGFRVWRGENRRALLASDLVFGAAFGFFLWVRLRHPELNDLEKLMDAALLGGLMRADGLPLNNPWLSGTPLTSYYHFGPLMGALPARSFGLSVPFAYNLVQPLFCALFVSTLWAIGAALSGSLKRGVIVVLLVALFGHFEPVRQWINPLPNSDNYFARLDWWSTSRVFPDTTEQLSGLPERRPDGTPNLDAPARPIIAPAQYAAAWANLPRAPWTTNTDYPWFAISEYPIFTMAIGDAHAHFYALALAALLFSLCFALFAHKSVRHRRAVLALLGILLGVFVMTNTWDVPLYALLVIGSAILTARGRKSEKWAELAVAMLLVIVVALPYLWRFKAQVSGVVFELWPPASVPFLVFWGSWLMLWLLALAKTSAERRDAALVLIFMLLLVRWWPASALVVTVGTIACTGAELWTARRENESRLNLGLLLGLCGLLGMAVPQFFYMQGFFGGGLRHQDTVFKFGLQGWLLLGLAASSLALRAWVTLPKLPRRVLGVAGAVLCIVPALCGWCIIWTRVVRDAPRDEAGQFRLSLDGARFLPTSDRKALDWLQSNAVPGEVVLEAVGEDDKGKMGGDFTMVGRVSALSGQPAPLGWPQHVWMWGNDMSGVQERWDMVRLIYAWPSDVEALDALRALNVHYIFVGEWERRQYKAAALAKLRAKLPVVFEDGDTFIVRVPDN